MAQLHKSSDRKLGGVCGGVAEYLDIDPTIVRILWALVTIFSAGTVGVIVYLVMWFVMPD